MASVLGYDAPSYQAMKNQLREFRCGRTTCKHAKGAGQPQTMCAQNSADSICDLIKQDRWLTTVT